MKNAIKNILITNARNIGITLNKSSIILPIMCKHLSYHVSYASMSFSMLTVRNYEMI